MENLNVIAAFDNGTYSNDNYTILVESNEQLYTVATNASMSIWSVGEGGFDPSTIGDSEPQIGKEVDWESLPAALLNGIAEYFAPQYEQLAFTYDEAGDILLSTLDQAQQAAINETIEAQFNGADSYYMHADDFDAISFKDTQYFNSDQSQTLQAIAMTDSGDIVAIVFEQPDAAIEAYDVKFYKIGEYVPTYSVETIEGIDSAIRDFNSWKGAARIYFDSSDNSVWTNVYADGNSFDRYHDSSIIEVMNKTLLQDNRNRTNAAELIAAIIQRNGESQSW